METRGSKIFISEIDALLVECAELIAYNGKVIHTTPEYGIFHKNMTSFMGKYTLLDTPTGQNINKYLLYDHNHHLIYDEVREIIISLLYLEKNPLPHLPQFDRVFISHSSNDIKYIAPFVKLLVSIGFEKDTLFCSSSNEFGIPFEGSFDEYIKNEFINKNLYVIMLLSEEYYKSGPCLNEMGATWVLSKEYIPILLDDFDFSQIKGFINAKKTGLKINDKPKLDKFKDNLLERFNLEPINDTAWYTIRDNFITEILRSEI